MGRSGIFRELRVGAGKRPRHAAHQKSDSAPTIPATGASRGATELSPTAPSNGSPPTPQSHLGLLQKNPLSPISPAYQSETPWDTGNRPESNTPRNPSLALGPDRFLTEEEASHFLGLSRKTLQAYRQGGAAGPAYHVLGTRRGIRYRLYELFSWAMAREVRRK